MRAATVFFAVKDCVDNRVKKTAPRFIRQLRMRPRLWLSVAVGVLVGLLLPSAWVLHSLTRSLMGWNASALLYLIMAFTMMLRSTSETMRLRAKLQDGGQTTILVSVSVASIAVLVAIAAQLAYAKDMRGVLKGRHLGLDGRRVVLCAAYPSRWTHALRAGVFLQHNALGADY